MWLKPRLINVIYAPAAVLLIGYIMSAGFGHLVK